MLSYIIEFFNFKWKLIWTYYIKIIHNYSKLLKTLLWFSYKKLFNMSRFINKSLIILYCVCKENLGANTAYHRVCIIYWYPPYCSKYVEMCKWLNERIEMMVLSCIKLWILELICSFWISGFCNWRLMQGCLYVHSCLLPCMSCEQFKLILFLPSQLYIS